MSSMICSSLWPDWLCWMDTLKLNLLRQYTLNIFSACLHETLECKMYQMSLLYSATLPNCLVILYKIDVQNMHVRPKTMLIEAGYLPFGTFKPFYWSFPYKYIDKSDLYDLHISPCHPIGSSTNSQQAPASDQTEGELHTGVVCDGCEKSIYGKRYRCMECPDYDLCGSCEAQGKHNHHSMLKMTKPTSEHPCFNMPMGPVPFHHGPHGHGPHGHHGRHGGHHRPGEVGFNDNNCKTLINVLPPVVKGGCCCFFAVNISRYCIHSIISGTFNMIEAVLVVMSHAWLT